ncbi:hypothetical protein EX84_15730, partial [Staphylococcus aureus]|uniref:PHP domain-containing protein n=1 Tax=Staphylococcus aureus TaxID=1280 RepID=UPI00065BFD6D
PNIGAYVKQSADWGHPAIAVTDHNVVQAFPDAHAAAQKHGIQMIHGMARMLADDAPPLAHNPPHALFHAPPHHPPDLPTTASS